MDSNDTNVADSSTVMILPLFLVIRNTMIPLSSALFLLYAHQVFVHRRSLRLKTLRELKTVHMFRLTGLVGSLALILTSIDYFGALGVLGLATRLALGMTIILMFWLSLWIAGYQAILATFVFLPNLNRDKADRTLRICCITVCIVVYSGILLAVSIPNAGLYMTMLVGSSIGLFLVIVAVNYVYFQLRKHQKELTAVDIGKSTDALNKAVRKWLIYTISLTVILSAVILASLNGLRSFIADPTSGGVSGVFAASNPLEAPSIGRISLPFSYFLILAILLFRSWTKSSVRDDSTLSTSAGSTSETGGGGKWAPSKSSRTEMQKSGGSRWAPSVASHKGTSNDGFISRPTSPSVNDGYIAPNTHSGGFVSPTTSASSPSATGGGFASPTASSPSTGGGFVSPSSKVHHVHHTGGPVAPLVPRSAFVQAHRGSSGLGGGGGLSSQLPTLYPQQGTSEHVVQIHSSAI